MTGTPELRAAARDLFRRTLAAIEVEGVGHLSRVMQRLEQVRDVVEVHRDTDTPANLRLIKGA